MRFFFRLTAPRCPSMTAGAVSLKKSHDIVLILSFCNIVKGQAKYIMIANICECLTNKICKKCYFGHTKILTLSYIMYFYKKETLVCMQ